MPNRREKKAKKATALAAAAAVAEGGEAAEQMSQMTENNQTDGQGDRPPSLFNKTKMCKFNLLGLCAKGTQCVFAHSREELNNLPDLYRTKLCKELIAKGVCEDRRCQYAHNKDELRTASAFYRTRPCKFFQSGHCELGDRCNYMHVRSPGVPAQPDQSNRQSNNASPQAMKNAAQDQCSLVAESKTECIQDHCSTHSGESVEDTASTIESLSRVEELSSATSTHSRESGECAESLARALEDEQRPTECSRTKDSRTMSIVELNVVNVGRCEVKVRNTFIDDFDDGCERIENPCIRRVRSCPDLAICHL